MRTSITRPKESAIALRAECSTDSLIVELVDGRRLSVPLAWYPRLLHGRPDERSRLELIGEGDGIHWPDLDEHVSVEGLLGGRKSMESSSSLKQWLAKRESPR